MGLLCHFASSLEKAELQCCMRAVDARCVPALSKDDKISKIIPCCNASDLSIVQGFLNGNAHDPKKLEAMESQG